MELQAAASAAIERMVYYDDEYKVLICREHRYAIRNLDTHLFLSDRIRVRWVNVPRKTRGQRLGLACPRVNV